MSSTASVFPVARQGKAPLVSLGWYFLLMGAIMGNWAAVIPAIAVFYQLTTGVLGAILVPAVLGAILAAPIVSYVIWKYGSKVAVGTGGIVSVCVTIIIGIPAGVGVLVVGVICLGFGIGWLDTSVNHQAILCEKALGVSRLGMFHALYAVGGLCGVLFGGALLQVGYTPFYCFVWFAVATVVPTVVAAPYVYSQQEAKEIEERHELLSGADGAALEKIVCDGNGGGGGGSSDGGEDEGADPMRDIELARRRSSSSDVGRPSPLAAGTEIDSGGDGGGGAAVVPAEGAATARGADPEEKPKEKVDYMALSVICGLGFLAYMGEGSIGDWSTVYLTLNLQAETIVGTLGYAGFQLVVAVGRLSLDWLVEYVDRKRLVMGCGLVAAAGFGIVGLAASLPDAAVIPVAIVGFIVAGVGISVIAPIVIQFAGTTVKGMDAASAIATVSSISYVGVMIGPPLLGGIAQGLNGLRWSLLIAGTLMLLITVLSVKLPASGPRQRRQPPPPHESIP